MHMDTHFAKHSQVLHLFYVFVCNNISLRIATLFSLNITL